MSYSWVTSAIFRLALNPTARVVLRSKLGQSLLFSGFAGDRSPQLAGTATTPSDTSTATMAEERRPRWPTWRSSRTTPAPRTSAPGASALRPRSTRADPRRALRALPLRRRGGPGGGAPQPPRQEARARRYDGFEPSGRMHIAQGVMKCLNVNKLTKADATKFWSPTGSR